MSSSGRAKVIERAEKKFRHLYAISVFASFINTGFLFKTAEVA